MTSTMTSESIGARLRIAAVVGCIAIGGLAVAADIPIRLSDLQATLDEVAAHAASYPPKFSTPEERAQIEDHLETLLKLTDKILDRYPDNKEVLFVKGTANAMGHNLDYPGSAERAMGAFERLLSLDPNDRRAAYSYGVFLSQTTLQAKAVPYLTKAIQLGEERAHYTLGVTYLGMGAIQDAIPEFEAYLKVDPENAKVQKLVSDLKSGKEKFHVKVETSPKSQ